MQFGLNLMGDEPREPPITNKKAEGTPALSASSIPVNPMN